MSFEFWTASHQMRIMSYMDLTHQDFVIIGGSSGIGLGTARAALNAGAARVVLVSRSSEKLTSAARALGVGERVQTLTADITRESDVADAFQAIGEFDHLITTAVDAGYQPVREFNPEIARRAIDSKLIGSLLLAKHGAPRLRRAGSLTVTSGIAAERPMPGGAVIAAVNGALASLVRALALELAPIRVNAISPGWVDTPVWDQIAGDRKTTLHAQMAERLPVRRIGTVDDLAHAILFLTQNQFTTGTVLAVDGGHRFV